MGLNKDFLCVKISFTIPLFIHSKTAHLCNVNYMLGIVGEERSINGESKPFEAAGQRP